MTNDKDRTGRSQSKGKQKKIPDDSTYLVVEEKLDGFEGGKILKFLEGFIMMGAVLTGMCGIAWLAFMFGNWLNAVLSVDSLTASIFFVFCLAVGYMNASTGGKS